MQSEGESTDDSFFIWKRISPFKDWFELYVSEQILARLMIKGIMVTAAQVETDKHCVVFEAEGIGSQQIAIYEANEEQSVIAKFDRRWSGHAGTLRFADGGELEWRRLGRWWKPQHVFTDRFGNPLLRFRPDGRAEVCFLGVEPLDSWDDLILLLSLGWFLLIISGGAAPPRLPALRRR